MKDETVLVSNCCGKTTHFFPPSLGERGFYVCSNCNVECLIKIVPKYLEVSEGIFRPIKH